MQADNAYNSVSFLRDWKNNDKYFEMLKLVSSLSKLFSESSIPYIDYRLVENLFCKYYYARNDARTCTAYDARLGTLGVGIKTFILKNGSSLEKIAEFNKLRTSLIGLHGIDLARKIGIFRNARMQFANDAFNVEKSCYHIIGRLKNKLKVFNAEYDGIDIENIHVISENSSSIKFEDGKNSYSFNWSKSVLMKHFYVSSDFRDVDISILEDPLVLLEEFFCKENLDIVARPKFKGIDYVILPLYSLREQEVPKCSGLNQWNAKGRLRDYDEVYIPIPRYIHKNYPNFFPNKDTPFVLKLPSNETLSVKICQAGGKALMSNPNKALGDWLLRKMLHKKQGELVTMEDLNKFGIDSVMIINEHKVEDNMPIYSILF